LVLEALLPSIVPPYPTLWEFAFERLVQLKITKAASFGGLGKSARV
jgi:hypothetical protein